MEIIFFILPMSFLLAIIFIAGFIWSTKKGQFDDLETPSLRMLLEDQYINNKEKEDHE